MNKYNEKLVSLPNIFTNLANQAAYLPTKFKGIYELASSKPDKQKSIGMLLEKHARQRPHNIAIRYEDISYTYDQVNRKANQIAHYLSSKGVTSGDAIAVVLENRPETLITVLAIVKLGAIASMINTSQRGDVLLHSLTLVKPKIIIAGEEMLDNLSTVESELDDASLKSLHYVADSNNVKCPTHYINLQTEIEAQPEHNPSITSKVKMHQPCYYIFTSGTTGLPKASVMTHYRWFKSLGGMGLASMNMRSTDVLYVSLPLYHNNALTVSLAAVLGSGACMAIARKFSVTRFWDDIRHHNATGFCYIGELCRYLLNAPEKASDIQHKVRVCVGNGLRPDIWMQFKNRFNIPHINEFYGASECNLVFTNTFNLDKTAGFCPLSYNIVKYDIEQDEPLRNAEGFMIPAKTGESGLLITEVNEKQPFEGYTDEDATNSKLLLNVFEENDRWFNTGDLVVNQGYRHVSFADRLGDTFRWKGENVATTEVESILMELDSIEHAVVYGVQVPNMDGRAGMATITPSGALNTSDWAELTQHVRDKLPSYEIPVFIRVREQQEVTGTFKYRKVELKKEAYHLDQVGDEPIYVMVGKDGEYTELTSETEDKINAGDISL